MDASLAADPLLPAGGLLSSDSLKYPHRGRLPNVWQPS